MVPPQIEEPILLTVAKEIGVSGRIHPMSHKRSSSMSTRQNSRFSRQKYSADRMDDSIAFESVHALPEEEEIKEYCKTWFEKQILNNISQTFQTPVLKALPNKPVLEEGVKFLHNGKIKVSVGKLFSQKFILP